MLKDKYLRQVLNTFQTREKNEPKAQEGISEVESQVLEKYFYIFFRVTAKMMEEYNELFRYEQSQARDLEEREKLILKHHRSLNCVLDREPTRRYY